MAESRSTPTPRKSSLLSIDQLLVDDRTVVLTLAGDLDLWSSPSLKSALYDLLAAGRTQLVLDLGGVTFMDSTGLGVMVGIYRRFTADERLVIAAPTPAVLRVLEITGLASGLSVFASRDAALRHVTEGAGPTEKPSPPLTADATLMLGIASTAMPFAQSAEDQAERWLRALRNHGESGAILASLGLSEAALDELEGESDDEPSGRGDPDAVAAVTSRAGQIASQREAAKLGTRDVLQAVIDIYGPTFYRTLAAHGVDPAELKVRIAGTETASEEN